MDSILECDVISVESVDTSPGTALIPGVTNALPAPEVPEALEMIADDQDSEN